MNVGIGEVLGFATVFAMVVLVVAVLIWIVSKLVRLFSKVEEVGRARREGWLVDSPRGTNQPTSDGE